MEGVVMSAVVPETDFALDELLAGIDASLITPMFQPIVDLRHGVAVGFEVLSGGPGACRFAPLNAIAALPEAWLRYTFFVNVSPDVMDAQTFLSAPRIVIEITERASIGDYLKLDMSVTRRVDREPYKQRIVRSMAEFAQNIGAILIAEGVETWQEAEALIGCGIEWAQGFLFARPMPRPQLLSREVSVRVM